MRSQLHSLLRSGKQRSRAVVARRLAAAALILSMPACGILGLDGGTRRILEVAPHKAGCTGLGPWLCLQVREPGETDFENLFETPGGFDFVWGFRYVIVIEEKERDRTDADESSIIRRLDRVLSRTREPPGTTFDIVVATGGLRSTGTSRYSLFAEPVEIECPPDQRCAEFTAAIATHDDRIRMTLRFPTTLGEPLEIVDWTVCADFYGSCL